MINLILKKKNYFPDYKFAIFDEFYKSLVKYMKKDVWIIFDQ